MMCAPAGPPFGLRTVAVGRPATVVTLTLSPVISVTVRGGVLPGCEPVAGCAAGWAAPACGVVTAVSASTAAPRAVNPRRKDVGKDTETPSSGDSPHYMRRPSPAATDLPGAKRSRPI